MGAATTLVIQGLKYLDPLGDYRNRDLIQEQLEKARKENRREDNPYYNSNWDAQHTGNRRLANEDDIGRAGVSRQISLTVPVWIRKEAARAFEPTDPEYQEYVKLQRDAQRMLSLKNRVADSILESVKTNPDRHPELRVVAWNGKVTGNMDIIPDLFEPPIYQVPCMLISTNPLSVSLRWRKLQPDHAIKLERVFRPLVVLDAASAAAGIFLSITYAITKAKLNETFGTNTTETKSKQLIETPLTAVPKTPEADSITKTSTGQGGVTSPRRILPYFPDINDGQKSRKILQDVVSSMPYSSAIQQAAAVFNHVKAARQKAAVARNVRGICHVRGVFVFHGFRGKFKLEVEAHYLPRDNVFVGAVEIRQRLIVIDYDAMQKLREKAEMKRLEDLKAKARTPADIEERPDQEGFAADVASPEHSPETSKQSSSDKKDKE